MDDPDIAILSDNNHESWDQVWNTAFDRLYQLGHNILYSKLSGEDHRQDREDVIIGAIQYITTGIRDNKFENWKKVEAYFCTVIFGRRNDFLRKKDRKKEVSFDPQEFPEPDSNDVYVPTSTLTPETMIQLFNTLKPPRPEIFFLKYVEGLTAQEIADRLGSIRGTVLSHLSRGHKLLRDKLQKR